MPLHRVPSDSVTNRPYTRTVALVLAALATLGAGILPASAQSVPEGCGDWKDRCTRLDSFRASRVQATFAPPPGPCPPLSAGLSADAVPIRQALRVLQVAPERPGPATASFKPESFMGCLKSEASTVRELQAADQKVIEAELRRLKIQQVSAPQLQELFFDPKSSYSLLKARIMAHQSPSDYYRRYALSGPFQNLEESMSGVRVDRAPDGSQLRMRKYERPALDEIAAAGSPEAELELLIRRSREVSGEMSGGFPISPDPSRSALTPTVAKLALFELIRDRLARKPAEQAAFLEKLRLKFDFEDPRSAVVKNPDFVTLHNGYFLGSMPEHYPGRSTGIQSSGFDCTALIQSCLGAAGVAFGPDFKILSSRLASLGDTAAEARFSPDEMREYRRYFQSEPLECEGQLKPGDIVAFDGHAFVFGGYRKDASGKLRIQTFEAAAGEARSAGAFFREIYLNGDSCGPMHFTSSGRPVAARIIRVNR